VLMARLLVLLLSLAAVAAAQDPVPLINQPLVPDAAKPGAAGFTLTVNGAGFVSGAVVKWNGSPRATTFVSKSQLKAAVPSSDVVKAGTASVSVVNPTPAGGTSNVVYFEVTLSGASPAFNTLTFSTGGGIDYLVAADFNRDGKLDLAATNYSGNDVSMLLGNGDGTFPTHVDYAVGSGPGSLAVGDFNGDGKLDLVVVNNNSNDVSVLLGNGDGTFQTAANYAVGSYPLSVAVGDFNGDGKLDLAVANGSSNNLSVLLGSGDGTFQAHVDYSTGSGSGSVAVGDFNGDGKLDLVVSDTGVSVLLGNGNGTFRAPVNYSAGPGAYPRSVTVADLNGDSRLDLVVADGTNNKVSVLLGKGDGTFQTAVSYLINSYPDALSLSVAVGDFNGDGKLDLAVGDSGVGLLLGNGDGTFQAALNYASSFGLVSPSAIGDFNGDGRLDIALPGAILLQVPTVSLSKSSLNFADQVVSTSSAASCVGATRLRSARYRTG
jgi:hypothetical protein